jgi:uncharacterized protein (TIGR04141 family)
MPKRTLALYLLKPDVSRAEDALHGSTSSTYEVSGLRDGKLFLRRTRKDEPHWLAFLRPHLDRQPTDRSTASLSGVLVFRVNRRWFALTFGYGRTLLDPEMVVSDFGLRAALNSVDPDELRSIDAKTLEELTVLTRRQLSRGASITTFELDLNRDLVRAVRGRSNDRTFAEQVSGSDALRMTADFAFADIAPRARVAHKLYRAKTYQQRFAWIDHVQLVTEPAKESELDEELEEIITSSNTGRIYLAAPSILDEDDFGGFRLLSTKNDITFELRWQDYLDLKQGQPSLASLRRDRIAVISGATEEAVLQWPVYRALVVEFERGGTRYVLTGGDWFEVDPSYARETRRIVERHETATLGFPAARLDEAEGDYNARVCQELGASARLMDRRLFRATQSQDPIEFCDIVLKPNKIVHVKRKSGSATLSHLFSQGAVSGELLHFDEGFRNSVRETLRGGSGFGQVIRAGTLNPSSYEIAFGIIAPAASRNRHFLPFFSQVNFRRCVEQLTGRGYAVSLSRIDIA